MDDAPRGVLCLCARKSLPDCASGTCDCPCPMCKWAAPGRGGATDAPCDCLQCIHDAIRRLCDVCDYRLSGRLAYSFKRNDFVMLMPQCRPGTRDVLMCAVAMVSRTTIGWNLVGARTTGHTRMDREFQSTMLKLGTRRAAVAKALPLDDADVVRMIAHAL